MYTIEKNISYQKKQTITSILRKMEIWDSFFVSEYSKRSSIPSIASKCRPFKFTTKKEGEWFRVWRVE